MLGRSERQGRPLWPPALRSDDMLTYKAIYRYEDDGVHAEVVDFPGVITCGRDLEEARNQLRSALVDLAETYLLESRPVPRPDPTCTDPEADLEEPIHLLLQAATRVAVMPEEAALETA
jgi:predicted RNase H-like HicB family nuclease